MRALMISASYQAAWLLGLWSCLNGQHWIPPLACLAVLAVALGAEPNRRAAALFLLASLVLGVLVESLLMHGGILRSLGPGHELPGLLPPAWLTWSWPAFATLFLSPLSGLRRRPLFAAIIGLLGAPLAYLGVERLGALSLGADRPASLLALSALWACMLPLLAIGSRGVEATEPGSESADRARLELVQ